MLISGIHPTHFFFSFAKDAFGIELHIPSQTVGNLNNAIEESKALFGQHIYAFFAIDAAKLGFSITNGLAVLLREFGRAPLDDVRHGIDVVAIAAAAQTGGFERDGTSACEGVEYAGHTLLEIINGFLQTGFCLLHFGCCLVTVGQLIKGFFGLMDG